MSSDTVFYWRRWPSPASYTGVPYRPLIGDRRRIARRVEQAAHLAHTLQDARRHSADQGRIHREHAMIAYRTKVRKLTPFESLSRTLRAGGSDQHHIGITREYRFLIDSRRQRGEVGEDIVAAAQRQHLADHMRPGQRIQRPVPHLVEDPEPRTRRIPRTQLRKFGPVAARGGGRRRFGTREPAELD